MGNTQARMPGRYTQVHSTLKAGGACSTHTCHGQYSQEAPSGLPQDQKAAVMRYRDPSKALSQPARLQLPDAEHTHKYARHEKLVVPAGAGSCHRQ